MSWSHLVLILVAVAALFIGLRASHRARLARQAAEEDLARLGGGLLQVQEAERALNTVSAYVAGIALSEAALHAMLARQGQTPQEWLDEQMRAADDVTDGHERLRTLTDGYAGQDPVQAMDDDFEYGLERVLDGLQARLEAST